MISTTRFEVLPLEGTDASFGASLEGRVRAIVNRTRKQGWDMSSQGVIERDLALALDHVDRQRALHEKLRRSLLRQECYINTLRMLHEPRGPGFYTRNPQLLDQLRRELQALESERRRVAAVAERERRELRDRLLILVNRHAMLSY